MHRSSVTSRQAIAIKSKSSPIVSKSSHRVWCIIKIQAVIRRWLAMRLLKKLKESYKSNEFVLKLKDHQQDSTPIIVIDKESDSAEIGSTAISTNVLKQDHQQQQKDQEQINNNDVKSIQIQSSPTQDIDNQLNNDINSSSCSTSSISSSNSSDIKKDQLLIEPLDISSSNSLIIDENETASNSSNETASNSSSETASNSGNEKEISPKVTQNNNNNSNNQQNNNNNNNTPFSSRSSSISSSISMSSSLSSSSLNSSVSDSSSSTNTQVTTSSNHQSLMRKRTLEELLKVEKGYVQDMTTMIDVFLDPFKTEACFPKHHIYTLFCNIEELKRVHQSFLDSLENRLNGNQWSETESTIGELFFPYMGSWQLMYEKYINNYEKAFALTRYFKISPNYAEIQKSIYQKEKDTRCRYLDFNSFLVMPVQRLPRYIVLLQAIEKYTSQDHPDFGQVSLALVQLQDLTLYLNESKRKASQEDKIDEIKLLVQGVDPILSVGQNKFVMEGPLSLLKGVVASTKKDLYIYLFKECILLCTEGCSNNSLNSSKKTFLKSSSSSSSSSSQQSSKNLSASSPTLPRSESNGNLSSPSLSTLISSPNSSSRNNSPNNTYQKTLFKSIAFSDVKAISILKNFKDSFQVVTSKKVYTFVASSTENRDKWVNSMNDCTNSITPPPSPTLTRSNRRSVQLATSQYNSNLSNSSNSNSPSSSASSTPKLTNKKSNRLSVQM
ncbi:hypothetical protein CYY_003786 [Polysphondylium violaceum]|uniref:Pleckstrin domain-containing protein n=1 Tax=Polysphondylium violaceum TaxID=133409 RepID=A0A8J4V8D1_9MYCE|nr:hypothetical protein CYY_003786 [Polysphondylium violaceum]